MSAPPTAPAAPPEAAATTGSPNQYHLRGHGVRSSYYPAGAGPLTVDGRVILTYQDAHRSLVFRCEQAHVVDVPELGTCVTVTLDVTPDAGSTTATLLIPTVVLPAGGSTTAETELITSSVRGDASTAHLVCLSPPRCGNRHVMSRSPCGAQHRPALAPPHHTGHAAATQVSDAGSGRCRPTRRSQGWERIAFAASRFGLS